jgi:two-component system sensor histidine kinase/response regulator
MSKDVDAQTLALHIRTAREAGVDLRDLFADTALDPDHLPEWVAWDDFALVTQRFGALCGSPERIAKLGEELIKVEELRVPTTVLRLAITPWTLYWGNIKWGGPYLFKNLQDTSLEVVGEDTFRATIHIPEANRGCEEFFYLNQGLFRVVPELIGLQRAYVEVDAQPHRGVFTIIAPPSADLFNRLRNAFRAFFSALRHGRNQPGHMAFGFLVSQQDHLRRINKALEDARATAEEQRRIAESALAVKSQFLATMSHELRTPLNGIMGVAELMAMTELTSTQHEYTHTIRDSGETLLSIINDILDFSKMEAGYLDAEQVDFSLRDLIADVLDLFAGRAYGRGLELIGRVDPSVPSRVRGNHRAVRQILQNLVSNAVKFTDAGEIEVGVDVVELEDPGKVGLRVAVRDTGQGIADEDLIRLFKPFAQLDASETRRHGGTGLGLAICRQLADGLGGRMSVTSQLREGSTFVLELSLIGLSHGDPSSADAAQRDQRLLVVDDNAAVRHALIAELELLGVEVCAVASAEEAQERLQLAHADRRPFTAALVDAELPEGGTAALAAWTSAVTDGAAPVVVLLTRSASAHRPELPWGTARVETLRKPVRAERLAALLRALDSSTKEPARPAVSTVSWCAPRRSDGGLRRVLVVEDHELNQRVARGMLVAMGVDVVIARDGVEALEVLAPGRFDAVLMDCQMPRMDGLQATRIWRDREVRGEHLPIIAMTAYASAADRARCLAAGMDDHVTKPVSMERLATALKRWLGLAAAPESSAPAAPAGMAAQGEVGVSRADAAAIIARLAELRELLGPGGLGELVDLFHQEVKVDLEAIERGLKAQSAPDVETAAHRLKGSCSNMGAEEATVRCSELMERARAGSLEGADVVFGRLRRVVEGAAAVMGSGK